MKHEEIRMSWLQRLLKPTSAQIEEKTHALPKSSSQTMPTVKLGSLSISKRVKEDLRRDIESLHDIGKNNVPQIFEAALRSASAGGDLHVLFIALTQINGMSTQRADEIALSVTNKATAQIAQERQVSLGITHAIWLYPNAPCMKNPKQPLASDIQQDTAHRSVNGKRYEVAKGMFVDGKWTWPGVEEGCKCVSRSVISAFE
jgi:hypothetical protein